MYVKQPLPPLLGDHKQTRAGVAAGNDARRGVREGTAAGGPGGGASAAEGK